MLNEGVQYERGVSRDRKMKGRTREYSEPERNEYREPKRMKSEDGYRGR